MSLLILSTLTSVGLLCTPCAQAKPYAPISIPVGTSQYKTENILKHSTSTKAYYKNEMAYSFPTNTEGYILEMRDNKKAYLIFYQRSHDNLPYEIMSIQLIHDFEKWGSLPKRYRTGIKEVKEIVVQGNLNDNDE